MDKLCECGCDPPVPYGKCHCYCGQGTPISDRNLPAAGMIKGEPTRYCNGHSRMTILRWTEEDRGYETPCHISVRTDARGYGPYRRVWMRTHGPRPRGSEIDHLCGVKACIRIEHLQLHKNHRQHLQRHATKLTMEDAHAIRASSESGPVLARRYGVTRSEISKIRCGKHWIGEDIHDPTTQF